MDLIEGFDLFSHISVRPLFTEHNVKFYASQVYLALDYLHCRGITYRDLKPENLVISDVDGYISLVDFGLAKWVGWENWFVTQLCTTTHF